jgi:hypothetical protein
MAVVDRNGKVFHPAEWATPTKAGFTDLYDNIPGAVYAVGGGVQAGNTHTFAVWWKGTNTAYPVESGGNNILVSIIYALSNGWAGGNRILELNDTDRVRNATIWKLNNTSSEQPVNLAPPGSQDSVVWGLTGATVSNPGVQVGQVENGAAYWKGTAASYVNLHPAGASRSAAQAVYDNQQSGWVEVTPDVFHAAMWSGTAGSMVDLQPNISGVTDSQIFGMSSGVEVGNIYVGPNINDDSRAFLWWDRKDSFVNLQDLLPTDYTYSRAAAADWYNGQLLVVGTAWNDTAQREEAMLWTYSSVPEPSTFLLLGAGVGSLLFWRHRS